MDSDIITIQHKMYLVINDEYFIGIYDLPINYDEKPKQYDDYFMSLFDRECSIFVSMFYNELPFPPHNKEKFIVNICNPVIINEAGNKLNIKINGRLYR